MRARQLHFDPEQNEKDRLEEIRREIRSLSSRLGWTPEDLDAFCESLVGDPILLWNGDMLDWLLLKFKRELQ